MAKGILGKKLGMTQIFEADGRLIPVTVVEAGPCVVLQTKPKKQTVIMLFNLVLVKLKKNIPPNR